MCTSRLESSTLPEWRYSDTVSFARTSAEAPPGEEHPRPTRKSSSSEDQATPGRAAICTVIGTGLLPGRERVERSRPRKPASIARVKRRGRDLNPRRTFQHVRDFQSRSLGHSDTSPRCEAEKEGFEPSMEAFTPITP